MELLKRLRTTASQLTEPKVPEHGLFFVRGHPRSGTNWVGALLNLHPQINCFGEFHFEDIRRAIDHLQSQPWHLAANPPVRDVLDQSFREMVRKSVAALAEWIRTSDEPASELAARYNLSEAFVSRLQSGQIGAWMGDRSPRGLRMIVDQAPHFLIIRDGRDVLVSWTFHVLRQRSPVVDAVVPAELRSEFNRLYEVFQKDPAHIADHPHELLSQEGWVRKVARDWSKWVSADMEVVDRIGAGKTRGRVQVIRYEKLHADTEGTRRAMYELLGLDADEADPLTDQTRTTPGFVEDPQSFWRHGAVGDWKRYFTDDARRWFKEEAGKVLIQLEYEKDDRW